MHCCIYNSLVVVELKRKIIKGVNISAGAFTNNNSTWTFAMSTILVYLTVQPTPQHKLAMDKAFSFMLDRVAYVSDGVKPDVTSAGYSVEYNGLVGEMSGLPYVTIHYEDEDIFIKTSFNGLTSAALAAEIGNRTLEELVDKASYHPDNILGQYRGPSPW